MSQSTSRSTAADLIFCNGLIYTVDRARPWAQAVAVKDGRIAAIGTNDDIEALRGPDTEVVDFAGRMMMPGLVDVHNHHTRGGQLDMFETSFAASLTYDEILALVRTRAEKIGPDNWICGGI